jgi:hypothetical protein
MRNPEAEEGAILGPPVAGDAGEVAEIPADEGCVLNGVAGQVEVEAGTLHQRSHDAGDRARVVDLCLALEQQAVAAAVDQEAAHRLPAGQCDLDRVPGGRQPDGVAAVVERSRVDQRVAAAAEGEHADSRARQERSRVGVEIHTVNRTEGRRALYRRSLNQRVAS